jgi:hypothetical protein
MEDIKLAEKLWDLANIVTGFAVAQVLATTFTLANRQMLALSGRAAHWYAAGGTFIFTAFYLTAIIWCNHTGAALDATSNNEIWKVVNVGRIFAVVLFTAAMLFTLYGHRRDEIKAEH